MPTPKIWFLTGASRGLGRAFAEAALSRGDRVAATARRTDSLSDLAARFGDAVLPIRLDVTDRADCFAAVRHAHEIFGRLDVVVNNAGYGLSGAVEEVTETEARAQLDTNLFGALWVTQAAVPILRSQRTGHLVQISSLGGVAALPLLGLYHASKWGLEGFTESLAQEVAPFGVKVTIVEPSAFRTDWWGDSMNKATSNPAYDRARDDLHAITGEPAGDPQRAATALLSIVDSPEPPLRVLFGVQAYDVATATYRRRLTTWAEWETTSRRADSAN
ncbi:NADP-dependent 3-hydroxy acid dehydrogenase YdfG [Actinomadura madurae]|uniref:NADP-dependent 3-hydroxy acid dehydrogenase YdfG n=1 Tax=Actinomadura madurae TaxID=1993 RepID=A0A1I5M2B1_9ACTN|nr:oxidoreductase [Actinomadura madurae]SFP03778.1 NADP-dependent 3-hydroxy acid dehydrogenase YdfG [Actinomadura madurae]